jgi:hypothetical protein
MGTCVFCEESLMGEGEHCAVCDAGPLCAPCAAAHTRYEESQEELEILALADDLHALRARECQG